MSPKTLAFYLPQFHRTPENDKWWGEGFTEWTAVKGAEPLFEEHYQPRVPMNNYYYNLLEHDTMAWQAELMKEYFVDGMCIYHYWFENGRRILEKPAENLLKWSDISMPFCFDWANVSWIRTWKKMKADTLVWSSIYETQDISKDGVLMQQCYGREKEWEEHFKYLLNFFNDKRYIKLNGKPVFLIDAPKEIYCLSEMVNYFNVRAKESGFQGIYFIGARECDFDGLNASFTIQPTHKTRSYDQMWEDALTISNEKERKTYLCGGVDFDNSPRMGKDAFIMEGASPQKFYEYYKKMFRKSQLLNNEFVFVNAWNEWGEGMYLEPDEKYGFAYLDALRRAVIECRDETISEEKCVKKVNCLQSDSFFKVQISNHLRDNMLLHNWLSLKEKGICFSSFFEKYGYQNIAIYGMGKLGTHLLHELKQDCVRVLYGIDKNYKECMVDSDIVIYSPEQEMPKVDAVVITIITQYGEIGRMLREKAKMNCSMVAIEEVIYELMTVNI